jgi:hypothetical protein
VEKEEKEETRRRAPSRTLRKAERRHLRRGHRARNRAARNRARNRAARNRARNRAAQRNRARNRAARNRARRISPAPQPQLVVSMQEKGQIQETPLQKLTLFCSHSSSTAGDPREPTASPVAPTPTTPEPTSANSIPIRASAYTISYDTTEDRLPTEEEYIELTQLTRVYLEEFMFAEFAGTSLTELDDFLTAMIRNSFTAGEPVLVDYRSIGLFNPSSIFLPTVRELDGLITRAFTTDNLMAYLALVQALPSQNIFSTTSTAILSRDGEPRTATRGSAGDPAGGTSTSTMAGIAAAAAGLVVLAAGLILLKRRRKTTEEEEYGEMYDKKGDAGDMTVAGETCNMSVDSPPSEMFVPWRDEDIIEEDELDEEDELEEEDEDEGFERRMSRVATQS